jgi:hypothetical protein
MTKALTTLLALCFFCSLVLGQDEEKEGALTDEQMKELIQMLGSDTWREREDAQKKLIEAGWAAGPALEEATKNDDPEIARRAKGILDKLCYVSPELKREMDAIFKRLQGRDDKEREKAFNELLTKGERAIEYVGSLIRIESDNKVELTIDVEKSRVTVRETVGYTVKLRNVGEKPVWIPEPVRKIGGSFREFGAGRAQVSWSRGGGRYSAFPFIYLEPGEEFERKGEFQPYSKRVGAHIMKLRMGEEDGIEYDKNPDEKGFLQVPHWTPESVPAAAIALTPEIVEGERGKEVSGVTAGLKIEEAQIEQGGELLLEFTVNNVCETKKKFDAAALSARWYVLVPVDAAKNYGGDGSLSMQKKDSEAGDFIEPGKSLALEAKVSPTAEPGEYYLMCGFVNRPEILPGTAPAAEEIIGEFTTNVVKVKITAPQEKQENP